VALRDRRCDVAVLPNAAETEGLHSLLLRQDRLVAMLSLAHPWSTRRSASLQDLAQERLLLREHGSATRARLDAALARAGLAATESLELGSREAVAEATAAGLGIGVVSESEFGHDRRLMKLPLRGAKLAMTEYLVCLESKRDQAPVAAFFDTARESFA